VTTDENATHGADRQQLDIKVGRKKQQFIIIMRVKNQEQNTLPSGWTK